MCNRLRMCHAPVYDSLRDDIIGATFPREIRLLKVSDYLFYAIFNLLLFLL